MTKQEVAAIGGKFWNSGGGYCGRGGEHASASWFVPDDVAKPVMMKLKDGTWGPRGF